MMATAFVAALWAEMTFFAFFGARRRAAEAELVALENATAVERTARLRIIFSWLVLKNNRRRIWSHRVTCWKGEQILEMRANIEWEDVGKERKYWKRTPFETTT